MRCPNCNTRFSVIYTFLKTVYYWITAWFNKPAPVTALTQQEPPCSYCYKYPYFYDHTDAPEEQIVQHLLLLYQDKDWFVGHKVVDKVIYLTCNKIPGIFHDERCPACEKVVRRCLVFSYGPYSIIYKQA